MLISGCAPQYVGRIAESEADVPVRAAYFSNAPKALDLAFRAACDAPGDEFASLDATTDQCRIPPTPDIAAFLLVTFDGALEAPRLSMQKRVLPAADGANVELSYFAEVPQKSGSVRRVYFKQPSLDRLIDDMLQRAGGTLP